MKIPATAAVMQGESEVAMLHDLARVSNPATAAVSLGATVAFVMLLGACESRPPREAFPEAFTAMAPQDSTPDQVRMFCTSLGTTTADRAYASPGASSQRASLAARIFSSCMERHNLSS